MLRWSLPFSSTSSSCFYSSRRSSSLPYRSSRRSSSPVRILSRCSRCCSSTHSTTGPLPSLSLRLQAYRLDPLRLFRRRQRSLLPLDPRLLRCLLQLRPQRRRRAPLCRCPPRLLMPQLYPQVDRPNTSLETPVALALARLRGALSVRHRPQASLALSAESRAAALPLRSLRQQRAAQAASRRPLRPRRPAPFLPKLPLLALWRCLQARLQQRRRPRKPRFLRRARPCAAESSVFNPAVARLYAMVVVSRVRVL